MRDSQQTRLQVLGLFRLHVDGARVDLPLQAQRVVGYLAVVQPVQARSVLAGSLWAESSQARALATLRNALWQLRKACATLVTTTTEHVALDPNVPVDLRDARDLASAIADGSADGPTSRAVDLLDTDLLTAWDDDWLRIERERLHQLRIHALEALADSLLREGRHAEAVHAALSAVSAEPLRESAQATLVRAFLAEGNASEAVRQYHRYRRLLAEELGLRPSGRMEALLRDLVPAATVPPPRDPLHAGQPEAHRPA